MTNVKTSGIYSRFKTMQNEATSLSILYCRYTYDIQATLRSAGKFSCAVNNYLTLK